MLETVSGLNREHGLTIVIVDQELQEIIPYAGRLALMDEGRIALLGPPAEVLDAAEAVRATGLKLPDVTEAAYQLRAAGHWAGRLPVLLDDDRQSNRSLAQGSRKQEPQASTPAVRPPQPPPSSRSKTSHIDTAKARRPCAALP